MDSLNFSSSDGELAFTKASFWPLLAGNCNAVPVIGSLLTSILCFGKLRDEWNIACVPTPTGSSSAQDVLDRYAGNSEIGSDSMSEGEVSD